MTPAEMLGLKQLEQENAKLKRMLTSFADRMLLQPRKPSRGSNRGWMTSLWMTA